MGGRQGGAAEGEGLMDDAGLQLLRSIEAMMKALVHEMRRQNDAMCNVTRNAGQQRSQNAERQARWRAKAVTRNVTSGVTDNVIPEVLKDLEILDQEKDPQRNVTPTSPHNELVVYGTAAFEKAIGGKYPFEKQDAKHIENLLKNHTLTVAKRVVDLACERFTREPFHAGRGLSFRLIYSEAAQLLTAKPAAANGVAAGDNGKAAAVKSLEETKQRNAALAAIKPTPPPKELHAMMAKIGNGK